MATSKKSIEETIEDMAKRQLDDAGVRYYTKTDSINSEIDVALAKAPSKGGGKGKNFPDIKAFITTDQLRRIPVMIEVKGTEGDLVAFDSNGAVANIDETGKPIHSNIKKYAVNGAIHYADAIINFTDSFPEVIAIGVNGYKTASNEIAFELGVYYVSKENLYVPKKIGDYANLSFLSPLNINSLIETIDNLSLSDKEIEERTKFWEFQIEDSLKKLNQEMHDTHNISEEYRVKLMAGLIMAGLGVKGLVSPLQPSELRGDLGANSNDGEVILRKIRDFLVNKNLPSEKRDIITTELERVFKVPALYAVRNGVSRLKEIYQKVSSEIMPFFNAKYHIDFTGKLFNTLNAWIKVPDRNKNDVVLTPRYVCEMMAKLCRVNKDSFVWDYALGSAGFLIAAMKLMIEDASKSLANDPLERDKKIAKIKAEQLLGIEELADIYILAVLNMILMGDGSTNIVCGDSLQYDGCYEQGEHKSEPFPANVFLLNPPYSADGKGMVFVEKALSRMTTGRAAVIIMENAGSGKGLPYTKRILEHNTLLASIKMSDIFKGKANVQTAIYLFEIGKPHDAEQLVKFVDMTEDGYFRGNRRKASSGINLRDTNNAAERYQEVIDYILGRKLKTNFFKDCRNEDTITLDGDDWVYDKHKKFTLTPKESDYSDTVSSYIDWRVSVLEESNTEFAIQANLPSIVENFKSKGGRFEDMPVSDFFEVKGNPQLNKDSFVFSDSAEYPYFTRTLNNNGILGHVEYLDEKHLVPGNTIAVGMMGMKFFYMGHDFYAGQFTKTLFPKFPNFNEDIALYFISILNMYQDFLKAQLVGDFEKKLLTQKISVPINSEGNLDCNFIKEYIAELKKQRLELLKAKYERDRSLISKVISHK